MKKIILSLSILCLVAFTSCKENDAAQKIDESNITAAAKRDASSSKLPVLEFEEKEHDFGEIEAKTKVETIFKYKNAGDAPLVITNIKSTCGCTVPEDWSREPLVPGGTGEFTVIYNGSGKGKVSKSLTVTANTEKGTETVKITAFVKPDPNALKQGATPVPNVGPVAPKK